jgi:hypothetical protein
MSLYSPKTGARCSCKRGVQRDNCPACEGTGWEINFAAIHARRRLRALIGCDACDCADPTALPGLAAECDCACHH